MTKLTFEQRQEANKLIESGVDEIVAFELIALRDFVYYVRKFYQDNFDVMPVAFQSVDNEAEALLESPDATTGAEIASRL